MEFWVKFSHAMENGPEKQIVSLFANHFGVEEKDLDPSLELGQDLNLSYLEIADFLLALENTFRIEIPQEESEKFKTLGDIVDYVVNHGSFT